MSWKLPLFKIYTDEADLQAVTEVLRRGTYWAEGPEIVEFERGLKDYQEKKYAVAFNSGTSALHAALLAYGIKGGDEVIVPSFTFIATANAPLFVKAKPIFADIEEQTLGLDPEDVEAKITPKTKAVIPVHYAGCPCKIRELREIADDHHLLLIEDAAESFGASIGDKKAGSYGEGGVLSFCQNKVVPTGEGGALVTDSREIYEKAKLIRSHGRQENSAYFSSIENLDYITLGYNFRMPSMIAALGIAQLKKIDMLISTRRQNAEYLTARLEKEVREITPPAPPEGYRHVYQMYTVMAEKRDGLMRHLADSGIMTKIYFNPVHLTRFYRDILKYTPYLPITEKVADLALTLPVYPGLTKEEMDLLVNEIKTFYELN
ncbi:DegT/DnrJ/EryC1/StrS family aminotransferase [Methanoculleus sp. UBA303]|jgi:perosamine synthetase|uniref:DegT/DnrJ/EryC1/StrS family aminotransferase n=1 Tax=Methanoculleus sp. UBA303 TaxID=1915497 RepID=UPI0025E20A24|nr:DegT/DnrJ/EryC1/StrS family aminotransferase [Methanoculleus sp. UBA303]MDD3932300.1 DegT/DnrJ/EryC1/StrS family aminotransferase [Methanoculleus sp.]